jgi:hypothetical protein
MKEIMFNFGIVILAITYCLFVHSFIKVPKLDDGSDKKLRNKLFVLLLTEILVITLIKV